MEIPAKKFLRGLKLGVDRSGTSDEHYRQRLAVIGWDPVIIRRVKHSLILAYKLIFCHLPYGDLLFERFNPSPPSSSVAGNTRGLQRLTADHPHPIHQRTLSFGNVELKPSARSFTFYVCRIWNALLLQPEDIDRLSHFTKFLDAVDWKNFREMHVLFSGVSDFFVNPETQRHLLPSGQGTL